jgi:hypothetical protein
MLFQRYDYPPADGGWRGVGPTLAGLVFMVTAWAVGADNGWWHKRTQGRPWLLTLLLLGPPAAVWWFFSTAALAGDIYICKGTHGENVYQNAPCATASKELAHRQYDPAMARAADGSAGHTERVYATPERGYAAGGTVGGGRPLGQGASLPPAGGLGSSPYQRGEVQGTRCVSATGQVYVTADACRTTTELVGSRTAARDWQRDQVQGRPDLVMSGPDQAFDPATGQFIQLQHAPETQTVNVYRTTQDRGTPMNVDSACDAARANAAQHTRSERAQREVEALCRQGRSLYDTRPSSRSLYGSGG